MRIEDYAFVGDTHSAAIVGRNGSIDWLCWPRFDSDACFAALLGDARNGCWSLTPDAELRAVRRRYRPGTLVLETELTTERGTIRLVDFMPPRERGPDLVRIVEGVEGVVPVRMRLAPRFGYGDRVPWFVRREGVFEASAGPDALTFVAPFESRREDGAIVAAFEVHAGEHVPMSLAWHPSHERSRPPLDPLRALETTTRWWERWTAACTYEGPWREQVVRSLLTLKALTYSPTGGLVAAITTSLPEQLGGVRNWDYRFCWVRDATITLLALMGAGYHEEAAAWREWLLRSVAGEPDRLQIMYGVGGERRLTELELPWLPGYEGSRPVRIGNAAMDQFQLDVYGEVMDCLHHARRLGLHPDTQAWHVQRTLLDFLESNWSRKDDGIWEVRGPRRHFTHSKVMAWVALDRAIEAVEQFGLDGPSDRWRRVRAEIHAEVCTRGYDRAKNAFTHTYDSTDLDASLLMIPAVRFLPAEDPRVRGTVAAIERELMHEGFVHRYDTRRASDGLPPGEGVFLACSFWLADNLVLQGRRAEAERLFERLLALANDVGLLSEEYDPGARRLVGNFPQAFSHVALVNSAYLLTSPEHTRMSRRRV